VFAHHAGKTRVRPRVLPTPKCATDTLVTPAQCRVAADLLGAEYRELELRGGHMWMLTSWPSFAGLF